MDITGEWPPRKLVVFLSRENLQQEDPTVQRLQAHWVAEGWTFLRFFTPAERIDQRVRRGLRATWPQWLHRVIKLARLLPYPREWWFLSTRRRRQALSVEARAAELRLFVESLPRLECWIMVGRSAGCRVATMVADECRIPAVVCLSYPFKHPNRPPEPERVAHLAGLRTPCFIVQGRTDSYGGESARANWTLSPAVHLCWCETDHSLRLAEPEWQRVLAEMTAFVDQHTSPVPSITTATFEQISAPALVPVISG